MEEPTVAVASVCIALAYNDEPLRTADILIMGILGIVFIYGKSGIYLPVCLLALLIPAKKFGGERRRRPAVIPRIAGR